LVFTDTSKNVKDSQNELELAGVHGKMGKFSFKALPVASTTIKTAF